MEFKELSDCDVPRGALVLWRPVADSPRSWMDDRRAPAHVHEAHVRTAPATGEPTWLGSSFRLGPASREELAEVLRRWLASHEPLRSLLRVRADGGWSRRTLAASGVLAVPSAPRWTGGGPDARRRIEAFFDQGTAPDRWPNTAFATVTDEHGEVTVYFAADHGNLDAYSMVRVAPELRALLANLRDPSVPAPEPSTSYLDFGPGERASVAELGAGHDTVSRWREFLDATGGACPGFPATLGTRGPVRQLNDYRWLLDDDGATLFSSTCHAEGVTTPAGLFACLGQALRARTGRAETAVLTLAHTRTEPRWHGSLGWFVGVRPLRFSTPPGAGFGDTAREVAAALTRNAGTASVPTSVVERLLGRPITPRFVVSYLDFRRMPDAGEWPAWENRMLRSRVTAESEVYLWLIRSRLGTHLSARFPDTALARDTVPPLLDQLADAVGRVACVREPVPAAG